MISTTVSIALRAVTCTCGVVFGLNAQHEDELRRTHATFRCPKGCSLHFGAESTEEKLRKQLEATEKRLQYARDDRDAADRRAAAAKGQVTKLKKRAHAGTCIHCNRTFQQLARHMATKHAAEDAHAD